MEIFKDIENASNGSGLSDGNLQAFVKYKFQRKIKHIRHNTLNMMINLGMISGPRYIEAVIERIHLTKSQFILDLEQGTEVIIPKEINQDFLPASYRYYDCLLMMV